MESITIVSIMGGDYSSAYYGVQEVEERKESTEEK